MSEEKKEENLLLRIVKPHSKISREVVESDIERVVEEASVLYNLCFMKNGLANGARAMSHPQICNDDPLRFFVTANRDLIINPTITRTTKTTIPSEEGCFSFPNNRPVIVQRHHKIEVSFITLMVDPDNKDKFKFSSVLKDKLSGFEARVWQHEQNHLDSIYIFNY